MTRRSLIILIVAVLVVGGAAAVIASTLTGGDPKPEVHTLPGGQTHTGPMPEGQHQMEDGQMMDDSQMGH